MARKTDAASEAPQSGAWLITFSDMVTLLLTFFVLIIAITTIDPKTLVESGQDEISEEALAEVYGQGVLGFANPSLLEPVAELFERVDELPPGAVLNQDEIKSAIFQLDPPPGSPQRFEELERDARDSVSVFRDERGMVLRWDGQVLFPEGGTLLREDNLVLLARVAEFLSRVKLPVSVESFTNPYSELEGGESPVAFELARDRSKVVLDFFASLGLSETRFRLGAFGPSRPVTTDPGRGRENSRLEIVIYKPHSSSWKG